MDILVRLAWALPLVLVVGLAVMFVLKRIVMPASPSVRRAQRMSTCESLTLSDETRVHLMEIDGKPYVLVESSRQTLLQAAQTVESARSTRLAAPWAQRLYEARPR